MLSEIRRIRDLINIARILLWVGFIILFLYSVFIVFVRDKSLFFGSILKEPFSNFESICIPIFCIFLIIEIKPFSSIWRFMVALIPLLFIVGYTLVICYAIFKLKAF